MKLNFNDQVQQTIQYIVKERIEKLDLREAPSKEYSCWGYITRALVKKFDRVVSLKLFKNWKYNVNGYRKAVCDKLKQQGFQNFEQFGKNF